MGALFNRDAAAADTLKGVTYLPFDAEVTPATLVTGQAKNRDEAWKVAQKF